MDGIKKLYALSEEDISEIGRFVLRPGQMSKDKEVCRELLIQFIRSREWSVVEQRRVDIASIKNAASEEESLSVLKSIVRRERERQRIKPLTQRITGDGDA